MCVVFLMQMQGPQDKRTNSDASTFSKRGRQDLQGSDVQRERDVAMRTLDDLEMSMSPRPQSFQAADASRKPPSDWVV